MAQLRNISTGVVITFDDALVGNFSATEWESVGTRSVIAPAKTAAKKAAPRKKAAAKKSASVAATKAVVAEATAGN